MKNLVIDKNAVKKNIRVIKEKAGGATIYADLSADASGLGLLETANLLRDEGIRNFAISDPNDARTLRRNGFVDETIMMLRSTADEEELAELIDMGVICTVGSYDAGVAINGIAETRKTVCEVQIKIDTGLGRYGFSGEEMDKITSIFKYMSNLAIVGVFTTFSESFSSRKTHAEMLEFQAILDKLTELGFETGVVHACDSAALFINDLPKLDAVRVDSALSGRIPGKNVSSLTKVGYIEAGIEEVGWFTKGHKITGGARLKKAARLAVLSVGYYHGFGVTPMDDQGNFFKRLFFNRRRKKHSVRINGHKVRVMGKIGLMHTIVDVTNVNCTAGDIAIMDADPINVKGLSRVYKA